MSERRMRVTGVALAAAGTITGCRRPTEGPPPVVVRGDGFVDIKLGLRRLGTSGPARFQLEARHGTRTNLDPGRGRACWCEKDDGYRSDLVFALSEPVSPR